MHSNTAVSLEEGEEEAGGGEEEKEEGLKTKYQLTPTSQWLKKPRRYLTSGQHVHSPHPTMINGLWRPLFLICVSLVIVRMPR